MFEFLSKLSFGGVRNLHSFDHIWSLKKGQGVVPKCTAADPSTCVLQAGTSKKAHALMAEHGFTTAARTAAIDRCYWKIYFPNGVAEYNPFGGNFQSNYNTKYHTGKHTISGSYTKMAKHFQGHGFYDATTCKGSASVQESLLGSAIVGTMCWEFGGKSILDVTITSAEKEQIKAAGQEKEKMMMQIIDKYIEKEKAPLIKFMEENRLLLWTGEGADFTNMYDAFKQTPFQVSSAGSTCAAGQDF